MNRLLRFISRIFDYLWLFLVGSFFLHKTQSDIFYYFALFFTLPILFIPIEALLVRYFRTTLGKIIFGFIYKKPVSWKASFKVALKKGFLILPLFLPGFNLIFGWLYYKELQKYPLSRFDEMDGMKLIRIDFEKPQKVALFFLALSTSIFLWSPEATVQQLTKVTPYSQELLMKCRNIGLFKPSDWIVVKSHEQSFIAMFPDKPTFEVKEFDIPRSDTTLTYMEHQQGDSPKHTIGSLELPQTWTKWGSSNVLKGAINFLADGAKVITKDKSTHENFPALEYELEKGEHIVLGKLVLVNNTLYKLEMECDHQPTDEDRSVALTFFTSFHPIPVEE